MAKKMKQQQAMGKANQAMGKANQANQQYGTEFGAETADVQATKAAGAKAKANKAKNAGSYNQQ